MDRWLKLGIRRTYRLWRFHVNALHTYTLGDMSNKIFNQHPAYLCWCDVIILLDVKLIESMLHVPMSRCDQFIILLSMPKTLAVDMICQFVIIISWQPTWSWRKFNFIRVTNICEKLLLWWYKSVTWCFSYPTAWYIWLRIVCIMVCLRALCVHWWDRLEDFANNVAA